MASGSVGEIIQHLRRTAGQDGGGATDGQLLDRFVARRDEAAFAALVGRDGPMVWGVCRRVLGSRQDAEDAFQATFLVLVRKAASVVPREMIANWLYGVAHQTALNARAAAARRGRRERQVAEMPEPAVQEQGLWSDLRPLLDQELSRLPDKYRAAIVLCDLEGKTRREAARLLGAPEGTLSARLARGRALLARRLARRGLAVSGAALGAVLARNAVAAGVPAAATSSTIKAASLLAAGRAAAGATSAEVAALTEGVLKAMLLARLKIATAILLAACLVGAAAGLGFSRAGEQPRTPNEQREGGAKRPQPADELRQLRAEVARLRAANREVESRLQARTRGKTARGRLVVKVYPVAGLIRPAVPEGTEAESLIRVIARTIEPRSWDEMGGEASMAYLPEGYSLVIRQSPDAHEQVQELLNALRKAKTEQEKDQPRAAS
jgi:RNA polymerase sigma factor (sigma-70 family)